MEFSPTPRRTRKSQPLKQSDLYSTVVIHPDDSESSPRNDVSRAQEREREQNPDIYAAMVFKDDAGDEDNDDDSLPPLLKRLPKDFGGEPAIYSDDDDGNDVVSVSGTMIVRTSRNSKLRVPSRPFWDPNDMKSSVRKSEDNDNAASYRKRFAKANVEEEEEEEEEGNFSTFVVRERDEEEDDEEEEMGSGTVVRRTAKKKSGGGGSGDGGGGGGGTMSRAVASMQAVGEIGGFGKQRKSGSGGGVWEDGGGGGDERLRSRGSTKVSSSSIPDSVTKEDPSTKYELLHELGKEFLFSKFSGFELELDYKFIGNVK